MKYLLALILLCSSLAVSAQSKVEILGARELTGIKKGGKEYQKLVGNVQFKQENATMRCDSALLDKADNSFEAFGNVQINENDSLFLYSNYLNYKGNDKKAFVREKVRLTDGEMNLSTEQLDYDLKTRIAYYTVGGHIVSGDNVLDSRIGSYDANSKVFSFKKSVVLTHPEYVLKSDTLLYNSQSKVAFFFGPTTIQGEQGFIYCENGWYNTYTKRARFSRNAYVINEEYYLKADSLLYGGDYGVDTAIRNVFMRDSVNHTILTGHYGIYNRNTSRAEMTKQPMVSVAMEDDSLHIAGDKLLSISDSANRKSIFAYHHVRMFRQDMQGDCDSMHYSQVDSMIYMEGAPLLWNEKQQMKADSIRMRVIESSIDKAWFNQNAIVIQDADSPLFNQLQGNQITAWFENKKIHVVLVEGNAENIHFQEDDSVTLSSMNKVACSSIRIVMDSAGKPEEINYLKEPKGTNFPIDKLPAESEQRLRHFIWLEHLRPKSKADLHPQNP